MEESQKGIKKSKARPPRLQKKKKRRNKLLRRLLHLLSLFESLRIKPVPISPPIAHKKRSVRPPITVKKHFCYYPVEFDVTAWKKRTHYGRIDDSTYDLNKKDFSKRTTLFSKNPKMRHPAYLSPWPDHPAPYSSHTYKTIAAKPVSAVLATASSPERIIAFPYAKGQVDTIAPAYPAPMPVTRLELAEKKPSPWQPVVPTTASAPADIHPFSWQERPGPGYNNQQALPIPAGMCSFGEEKSIKLPIVNQRKAKIYPHRDKKTGAINYSFTGFFRTILLKLNRYKAIKKTT